MRPNQGQRTVHSLPADGFTGRVPKLPSGHHPETVKWYRTWSRSPQAATFIETDWQRLHQVAFVVDELYQPLTQAVYSRDGEYQGEKRVSPPVTALMAEIRQEESLLGATVRDRASLYMTLERTEDKPAATGEQSQRSAARRQQLRVVDDATG